MIITYLKKIHLKFCKSILGVHAKASNDAVRGEFDRRSILFFILKSAMEYWIRLQAIYDKNTLLYKTFRENVDLALHKKCCWLSNIQSIYKIKIKQETWRKNEGKINRLPHIFYNTVTDTFDTTWKRNYESNTSKLRIYKTFKKKIKLETYLLLFENYKHRKELTKLKKSL